MARDFISKSLQCKDFCTWISEVCVEYTAPEKTSGSHFQLSARKRFHASTVVNILSCDAHSYFCSCLSFFGRAFEKAAESTSSRTLHNHFEMSSEWRCPGAGPAGGGAGGSFVGACAQHNPREGSARAHSAASRGRNHKLPSWAFWDNLHFTCNSKHFVFHTCTSLNSPWCYVWRL